MKSVLYRAPITNQQFGFQITLALYFLLQSEGALSGWTRVLANIDGVV